MQIELNKFEVIVAGHIGMLRNAEASINKRAVRFPEKKVGELWGNHIESAMSEMAVSKYLGIYWGFGVNTFHVSDIINTELEIRWSSREDVKIRPDDTGIIVSVTGKCPTYELKGWYIVTGKQIGRASCRERV